MTKRSGHIPSLRSLVIVLLLNIFFVGHGAFAGERVFMWKIESAEATAYILGTIHMVKKDMYPLDSRIENAFARSDSYALEFNIDNVTNIQMGTMLSDLAYSGCDTIQKHISKKLTILFKRNSRSTGFPSNILLNSNRGFWLLWLRRSSIRDWGSIPSTV